MIDVYPESWTPLSAREEGFLNEVHIRSEAELGHRLQARRCSGGASGVQVAHI
jgi:hypothetical protein